MKNYKLTSKKDNQTLFAGYFKNLTTCLEEAIIRHTPLPHIDLRGQNLTNANLDDAIIPYADLTNANLSGANLSESYCKNAIFKNTSLFNTCFAYSNISNCDFRGASFGATDMTAALIDGIQFSTLSAFGIDFGKTRQMHDCTFTARDGTATTLSRPPIVINGIHTAPIIITETNIYNGHKRLTAEHAKHLLQRLRHMANAPVQIR